LTGTLPLQAVLSHRFVCGFLGILTRERFQRHQGELGCSRHQAAEFRRAKPHKLAQDAPARPPRSCEAASGTCTRGPVTESGAPWLASAPDKRRDPLLYWTRRFSLRENRTCPVAFCSQWPRRGIVLRSLARYSAVPGGELAGPVAATRVLAMAARKGTSAGVPLI
jgi:hypothetical protein